MNTEKMQKKIDKVNEFNTKLNKLGKTLTLMLTVPILLAVFFGVWGAIIGGVIFLLVVIGSIKKEEEEA